MVFFQFHMDLHLLAELFHFANYIVRPQSEDDFLHHFLKHSTLCEEKHKYHGL